MPTLWLLLAHSSGLPLPPAGTWAQFKGQAQRWFLLKFTGSDDSEINLETQHREFADWHWLPLQELPGSVISFKQDVYRQVAAEFGPIIESCVDRQRQQQQ